MKKKLFFPNSFTRHLSSQISDVPILCVLPEDNPKKIMIVPLNYLRKLNCISRAINTYQIMEKKIIDFS